MVIITQEMYDRAEFETNRRNPHLHPHFTLKHIDEATSLGIGFISKFAYC